jgi:hypothetical protein
MGKVTIKPAGNVKLSPNFWLAELTVSETAERRGIDNVPDTFALANLYKTAALLEQVRALLGNKTILVSSGYRGPELNAAIGGAKSSDHMRGEAADFRCPSYGSPLEVCRAIVKSNIKFGQLIWEGTWVHISVPDGSARDGEVLTATFVKQPNGKTKAVYSKGLPA